MYDIIHQWFVSQQLSSSTADLLTPLAILLNLLIISLTLARILKWILRKWITKLVAHTQIVWDDILLQHRVFGRTAALLPGFIIAGTAYLIPQWQEQLQRLAYMYSLLMSLALVNVLLNSTVSIYQTYEISRVRPIKGYIQVAKIVIFILVGILVIAALLNQSPLGILTGLGAMSAVLLLIFKDTLLGFIASIQMAMNDMVRIGDWIEMSKYGADGDVIDITVTTVKVRNWDKTITTIPTYSLISDSFKNWRGMSESGGRRIKRALYIDMTSVRFCDQEMLDHFGTIRLLQPYLENKKKEINTYNKQRDLNPDDIINGRQLTNIGTLRAYILEYLRNHPQINKDMTLMVRQLAPTPNGLPLELYTFSADQEWAVYENIQGDIFDHLFAILPEFDLRVFQSPSGYDLKTLALKPAADLQHGISQKSGITS
ncbi:MAG: mechanosensitive ion channel [Anaerolineales bacterium]|nr:mechanosensitive ion channel [Anaerolineales bacterium]